MSWKIRASQFHPFVIFLIFFVSVSQASPAWSHRDFCFLNKFVTPDLNRMPTNIVDDIYFLHFQFRLESFVSSSAPSWWNGQQRSLHTVCVVCGYVFAIFLLIVYGNGLPASWSCYLHPWRKFPFLEYSLHFSFCSFLLGNLYLISSL